ncbi:MAG: enoyl-CoA hydratase/isomerase family protein [Oligoflexia bacterium]|nr:enoyl-CoA hydratase/isomerase family protein [Oligoflexia bacterium]
MNKHYKTIETTISNDVAYIYLNRPEVHNAFNDVMIDELTDCFKTLNGVEAREEAREDLAKRLRLIVLEGRGKTFCSGVDINWMKDTLHSTYEDTYKGSLAIAECMHTIFTSPTPTIAKVFGGAFGGATGLLSACDMVFTSHETTFSLSEVKIGLVPACIAPYVINRVGMIRAKELMLSGIRIGGQLAESYGLANQSAVSRAELEKMVNEKIELLLTGGPQALKICKQLIHNVVNMDISEAKAYTAKVISEIRMSDEGQEGMNAFLEKRKANWSKGSKICLKKS